MGFVRDYIQYVKVRRKFREKMMEGKIKALDFMNDVLGNIDSEKNNPSDLNNINDIVKAMIQNKQ